MITKRIDSAHFRLERLRGDRKGSGHPDDPARIECPGTKVVLLTTPDDQGSEHQIRIGHEQPTDPFGAVEFMRREADQVGLERKFTERYFPYRLGRVEVQNRAVGSAQICDRTHILKRSDFIVPEQDRDQANLVIDRLLERIDIDTSDVKRTP